MSLEQLPETDDGIATGEPTGIAALVLGALACVLLASPFWAEDHNKLLYMLLAFPVGIAALVSGMSVTRRVRRGEATRTGMARAGIVLGTGASLSVAALVCWGLWVLSHLDV
ncbi:hypothetical protein ACQUSR_00215 [Streptomyces sp. P1-3]|uniref:hypothetical protein n=1 Tax=Streptomyces sp. P1-3 TaxID=3421658 RepID=UPI003D36A580